MGASFIPLVLFTAIWAVVALIIPFMIPKNPNRGVLQVTLMLTGACCWLFWLCCYMSQMNPLIGPVLSQKTLFAMKQYWD